MGMFGSLANFLTPDKLAIIGATLKDASPGSNSDALQGVMSMQAARAQKAQQDAFYQQMVGMLSPQTTPGQVTGSAPAVSVSRPSGLFGGQAAAMDDPSAALPAAALPPARPAPADQGQPFAYQPGTTTPGLSIGDPRMATVALMANRAGVPIKDMIEVLKAQQADIAQATDGSFYNKKNAGLPGTRTANRANVNGTIADLNDPANTNRVISEAPVKGAMPVYDNLGRVVDWTLPSGARDTLQASAEAAQAGQTRGTMLTVPKSGGGTRLMLGGQYLASAGGGGGPGSGGIVDGLGDSQSPADAAYATDNAKAAATTYQGLQTAAQKAPGEIAKYQRLGALLDGYEGGKYSPALKDLTSAANSLGFKLDKNLPNKEAAAAITNQLALSLRDPSNGGGMPGAMSDADRNFLVQSVPGLVQTAAGRKSMVEAQVKVLQRNQDVAAKARVWQQRFGRIDKPDATGKTFQDYLDAYAATHPLFAHQ